MKKQLIFILMTLLPMVASADDSGTCGENLNWTYSSATNTLIIDGHGSMSNYTWDLPAPWKKYNVTKVEIKDGVTSVGDYAFSNCSDLNSITIPNSIITIGEWAFSSCIGIRSFTIPNSVTSIAEGSFFCCSALKSVNIGDGLMSIGEGAFSGCGLQSLRIPPTVNSIEGNPFSQCSNLQSIYVDEENKTYDSRENCNAVINTSTNTLISGCNNTIIPNSVTEIYSNAFNGCSGLTSVTISDNVKAIGYNAFRNCSSLNTIFLGNGLKTIPESAFEGCSGLTSLNIPNNVVSISNRAFYGCTALNSITIGEGLTNISYDAFEKCNGIEKVTFHCKVINGWFNQHESIKEVIIGDEVESIGDAAFVMCTGLTSITIPSSVTSIGSDAFRDCNNLSSITIPSSVTYIGSGAFNGTAWYDNQPDGLLYVNNIAYKYKGTMPNDTSIEIANGTTSIANNAFAQCGGLTSVTIPQSVITIGSDSFYRCSGLSSINIPYGVTKIEYSAFSHCMNLTTVSISSSVNYIGAGAFQGCNKLTAVYISDIEAWCKIQFSDKRYSNNTEYSSTPLYYAHHLFLNGEEVKDVVIPNSITSIDEFAFQFCTELTSVKIPKSVESIGNKAFYGCEKLMIVTSDMTEPFNSPNLFSENTYRKGTLYVPAGTKDLYSRFDGWREFLKIVEMGGEPEQFVWLTMKDAQSATKIKLKKGTEQEMMMTPETGWKLLSVTMNGKDITDQVKDGASFTTPAIMNDATIIVVYEEDVPSGSRVMNRSQATIKVVEDGVIISNAGPDSHCVIYQTGGKQVVNTVINEGTRKITLQQGQVYILTIDGRTLKFAL